MLTLEDVIGARVEAGLSQREVAVRAGLDPSTVSRLETGKRTFNQSIANVLMRAIRGEKVTAEDREKAEAEGRASRWSEEKERPFVGYRLIAAMEERGMNTAGLARKMHTNRNVVDTWTSGACQPSEEMVEWMSGIFRKPIDYFYEPMAEDNGLVVLNAHKFGALLRELLPSHARGVVADMLRGPNGGGFVNNLEVLAELGLPELLAAKRRPPKIATSFAPWGPSPRALGLAAGQ